MPNCAVFGCNNNSRKARVVSPNKEPIKFYSFPKDPELRMKWLEACKRLDKVDTSMARICSDHFLQSSKDDRLRQTTTMVISKMWRNGCVRDLREDAIPMINLPSTPGIKHRINSEGKKIRAYPSSSFKRKYKISNENNLEENDVYKDKVEFHTVKAKLNEKLKGTHTLETENVSQALGDQEPIETADCSKMIQTTKRGRPRKKIKIDESVFEDSLPLEPFEMIEIEEQDIKNEIKETNYIVETQDDTEKSIFFNAENEVFTPEFQNVKSESFQPELENHLDEDPFDNINFMWRCPLVFCPEKFEAEWGMYQHLNLDHVLEGLNLAAKAKKINKRKLSATVTSQCTVQTSAAGEVHMCPSSSTTTSSQTSCSNSVIFNINTNDANAGSNQLISKFSPAVIVPLLATSSNIQISKAKTVYTFPSTCKTTSTQTPSSNGLMFSTSNSQESSQFISKSSDTFTAPQLVPTNTSSIASTVFTSTIYNSSLHKLPISCVHTTSAQEKNSHSCITIPNASIICSPSLPVVSSVNSGSNSSSNTITNKCSITYNVPNLKTNEIIQVPKKFIVAPISDQSSNSSGAKKFLLLTPHQPVNKETESSKPQSFHIITSSSNRKKNLPPCATDNSTYFSISLDQFPDNKRIKIKQKLLEVIDCIENMKIEPDNMIFAYYKNPCNSRTV